MAYSTRSVRHTLVARAYDLFLDPQEGRETPLGTIVSDAVQAGLLAAVQADGTWNFAKGPAHNVPDVAQLMDEIDSIIAGLPRVAVPMPIIGYAANRESNPYSDIIANGQGALEPFDNTPPRFVVLDDIAQGLFERDLATLENEYAVTLPVSDYQRIQRSLTAKIKQYGTLHSERLDDTLLRVWLPATNTDPVREALFGELQNSISKAARDRVHEYLVQGYGKSFFGETTSLEAIEARLQRMGPTQFDELHKAIGVELHAARQAQYGAEHDERAARLADMICNQGGWTVTNNFLEKSKSPAAKRPFPARPPFDPVLDVLLARKPEALGRFESSLRAQLNSQTKLVMEYSESVRSQRVRPRIGQAMRGEESIASDRSRNMAVARAAGVAENVQRELLNDALKGNDRERYYRDPTEAQRAVEEAYARIGTAPTYLAAQVRRAIADELRRSLSRDQEGRPDLEGRFPKTFQAALAGNRHRWETRLSGAVGASRDGAVNGVITALYGATANGTVQNFINQLRGPKNVKGEMRWDSPFPPFMDHALLAVIQPVIVPRDLDTVGRLLRQGFGRDVALSRMTSAFAAHLRDLRTHDDRDGAAALLTLMNEAGNIDAPTTKRAFTNRWCDTTANDLAISMIDKMLHDTTSRYSRETVRLLPLNIRATLTDVVFSHVDAETMRSLAQTDENTKYFIDLTSVRAATLDRRGEATEANLREQNYSVYGVPHTKDATPISTYAAIVAATGKSAYLRDTISARLNPDGTVALTLTNPRVLLRRREQREAAETVSRQTLTQDDFLRSLRDRVQDSIGSAYDLQFRYSTPTAVSIPKTELQKLDQFRKQQAGSAEMGVTYGADAERAAEPDDARDADDDHDIVFEGTAGGQSDLDLFVPARIAALRAGTFRPTVTMTLHAPESLNPGATFRGHVLHSDRIVTSIVAGSDIYSLPTSPIGTTLEVGSFVSILWRDENTAQVTKDPTRFSPELGALARPSDRSVKEIVSHERAALRMILAQNEQEFGPMRGMTAAELDGKAHRLGIDVIGTNEPRGYAIGRDDHQRAIVMTYDQLGFRPNVGDQITADIIPDEREGYRVRPIERVAQPTRDPINQSYEQAMESIARLHIAQSMQIAPDAVRSYEPPAEAHNVESRVVFTSTDLTYFAVTTPEGPRIVSAPTFGRLESLGTFGDPEPASTVASQGIEGFANPAAFKEINALQLSAKELLSMGALGETRKGYFDKLATAAIPPVPEVLQACDAGGARLFFESGKLKTLEPMEIPHDPIPHAVFHLHGTVSQVSETQRIDKLARDVKEIMQLDGPADTVRFQSTVAHDDDEQVVILGSVTDGRVMITPLDRELINDPDGVVKLYNDVELVFDESTQRYSAALITSRDTESMSRTQPANGRTETTPMLERSA
jgi:hypothetical protein